MLSSLDSAATTRSLSGRSASERTSVGLTRRRMCSGPISRAVFGTSGIGRAEDSAGYLYALARGIQKRARLFAVLESLDNGKPIRESRDADIPLAIRHFYHHAGWAQLIERELPVNRDVVLPLGQRLQQERVRTRLQKVANGRPPPVKTTP